MSSIWQMWRNNLSLSRTQLSNFTFTFMHWRRKWQPTPVFLPGESQGRGSLVAAIYGVAQSRTRLKWLSSSSSRFICSSAVCFILSSGPAYFSEKLFRKIRGQCGKFVNTQGFYCTVYSLLILEDLQVDFHEILNMPRMMFIHSRFIKISHP